MKIFDLIFNHSNDHLEYRIPEAVIQATEKVLREYSAFKPSHEGIVYWAGFREKHINTVTLVVAPRAKSNPGGVFVSHDANFEFVKVLSKRKLVHIGQVHTHPSGWVGHSLGDDQKAAFKVSGLLSIVVPNFCKNGMRRLRNCGVHRFESNGFKQLRRFYIKKHFHFRKDIPSYFEDLR